MNEDDADQGTGLDTKYRIDSAQGMSRFSSSHFYSSCIMRLNHPFARRESDLFVFHSWLIRRACSRTQAPSGNKLISSIQQDCHYGAQIHSSGSISPSTI